MNYLFIIISFGAISLIGLARIDISKTYRSLTGQKESNAKYSYGLFKCALAGIVNSQFQLASCYAKGLGIRKDEHEAAEWYGVAADKGHAPSEAELFKLVKPLAEHGVSWAQAEMGICYEKGYGVSEEDKIMAQKWYQKAAEQGNYLGQIRLGMLYQRGVGVDANGREALKWYKEAANQGNVLGICFVGSCYEWGVGVRPDKRQAAIWYQKAEKINQVRAKYAMNAIKQNEVELRGKYIR
jgi:TPR repeat protein